MDHVDLLCLDIFLITQLKTLKKRKRELGETKHVLVIKYINV